MKMKKIIILSILLAVLMPAYQAWATPRAEVVNPVYTFDTVPEGTRVSHEFILRNTGDDLLTIIDVIPP